MENKDHIIRVGDFEITGRLKVDGRYARYIYTISPNHGSDTFVSRILIDEFEFESDEVGDPISSRNSGYTGMLYGYPAIAEHGIFGGPEGKLIDRTEFDIPVRVDFGQVEISWGEATAKLKQAFTFLNERMNGFSFTLMGEAERTRRYRAYNRRYENRGKQIARKKAGKKP